MRPEYESLIAELKASPWHGAALRKEAMQMLDALDGFNWSGVYRLEGDELVLDEYVGAETDHTRIPIGRGVCGSAIAEDRNMVIPDVRELSNYLACSVSTRSEIVVLIRRGAEVLGQIDIDGHEVGRFQLEEEDMLEAVAEILANHWEGPA